MSLLELFCGKRAITFAFGAGNLDSYFLGCVMCHRAAKFTAQSTASLAQAVGKPAVGVDVVVHEKYCDLMSPAGMASGPNQVDSDAHFCKVQICC